MKLANQSHTGLRAIRLGRYLYVDTGLDPHDLVPWHEELPRERRIRDRERMRERARHFCWINHRWHYRERPEVYREIEARERQFADTLKRCSCRGCGNQRKYEGAPIRERRHHQKGDDHDGF